MSREYVANAWDAITPHNTNLIQCNGIYVGGAGNVRLIQGDSDETFTGVAAGTILPVFGGIAIHTDSTATLMIALKSV
jgi:hypothetical protein